MDPAKSPLNQHQQDRLNSILNTPTQQPKEQNTINSANQVQTPNPNSLSSPTPAGLDASSVASNNTGLPNPPVSENTTQNPSTQPVSTPSPPGSPTSPTPASTYQVPTVGLSTPPQANPGILGTSQAPAPSGPQLKPSTNTKPIKIDSGFHMMTIFYIIGGILLLLIYTVIWAVVFDLKLPFGITLPF